eukprot:1667818-Prymnesium_polylepis.1
MGYGSDFFGFAYGTELSSPGSTGMIKLRGADRAALKTLLEHEPRDSRKSCGAWPIAARLWPDCANASAPCDTCVWFVKLVGCSSVQCSGRSAAHPSELAHGCCCSSAEAVNKEVVGHDSRRGHRGSRCGQLPQGPEGRGRWLSQHELQVRVIATTACVRPWLSEFDRFNSASRNAAGSTEGTIHFAVQNPLRLGKMRPQELHRAGLISLEALLVIAEGRTRHRGLTGPNSVSLYHSHVMAVSSDTTKWMLILEDDVSHATSRTLHKHCKTLRRRVATRPRQPTFCFASSLCVFRYSSMTGSGTKLIG